MVCLEPLSIRRSGGRSAADRITVPCGKCAACLTNRRNEWSLRLSEELKSSTSAQFVTLTYSDDNMYYNDEGFPSVSKDEMQRYMKRLRKLLFNIKFRYYLVGEYGTMTKRPHYHFLGFNIPVDLVFVYAAAWQDRGHVKVGTVSEASIMYVCKYHLNKTDFPSGSDPSFVLMSRRPGIGYTYVSRMYDYHNPYPDRTYMPLSGGVKHRLPRYFKEKLWTESEREHLKYDIRPDDRTAKQIMDQAVDYTRSFKQKSNLKNKF